MFRIILICIVTVLLSACEIQSPAQTAVVQERLACADVGIDPGSLAFGQCVGDLDRSLQDTTVDIR
jgi:hypothetical protein